MRRRAFIGLLAGAMLAAIANAQQRQPVRRIAVLTGVAGGDPEGQVRLKAFQRGLGEAGWAEGRNLHVEQRWAAGDPSAFRAQAANLVGRSPEAILANTPPADGLYGPRPRQSFVFTGVSSPVNAGFVENLARPGGNVTGLSTFDPAMAGKWVELLKEVAPGLGRVAVLPTRKPQRLAAPSFFPRSRLLPVPCRSRCWRSAMPIHRAEDRGFARHRPAGGLIVAPIPSPPPIGRGSLLWPHNTSFRPSTRIGGSQRMAG